MLIHSPLTEADVDSLVLTDALADSLTLTDCAC